MALNPTFYDAPAEAAVNAVVDRLNSGLLRIYDGSQPALNGSPAGTLLAELTLNATAFGDAAASGGTVTATANSITADSSANASGTASNFALVQSDGTTVEATGTVGTSGADLNLNSTAISAGANVSVSAFTVTMPQT